MGNIIPNNELIIDDYAFDKKSRNWYNLRGFTLIRQEGKKLYDQNTARSFR